MQNLRLPMDKKDQSFSFSDDIRKKLTEEFSSLEDKIDAVAVKYWEDQESVSSDYVKELLAQTYKLYVSSFDYKRDIEKVELLEEEQKIYDFCCEQLAVYEQTPPLEGFFAVLWRSVECVRNLVDAGKEWFGLASDKDKANNALAESGHKVAPTFGTALEALFLAFVDFFKPDISPLPIEIVEGQIMCAKINAANGTTEPESKPMAQTMVRLAEYGFSGKSDDDDYRPLTKDEIPEILKPIYDQTKGFLHASRGLMAWLAKAKKGNDIVISFSGTHTDEVEHWIADVAQVYSPTAMYLLAAGLVNMMANKYSDKKYAIYVTGHSLGGGLTQFSVAACGKDSRIKGYSYNPAGLSVGTVTPILSNIGSSTKRIWHFVTCKDPISRFGGKLGRITTLPETGNDGHSIDDVKKCIEKYVTSEAITFDSTTIALKILYHSEDDYLPDSKVLSLATSASGWLPIFANDQSTAVDSCYFGVIYKALYDQLNLTTTDGRECFGVINKLNGSAYTVVTRLLALGFDVEIGESDFGLMASTIFFGRYGMGIVRFQLQVIDAYLESGLLFDPEQRQHLEEVIAELGNTLEYERNAWMNGAWNFFGMDLREHLEAFPDMKESFEMMLVKNLSDRTDRYELLMNRVELPSQEDIKEFIIGYGNELVLNVEDYLLLPAIECGMFTQDEFQVFRRGVANFVNTIIATVL